MYHISNDKRAKKSAERIGNGLLTCLHNNDFVDITVTDIQKTSAVGRATFYRLFDNASDVLSYLCDNVFEKVGHKFEKMNNRSPKETSLKFIQEWMDNKTLLKAIVDCNRTDFIFDSHIKYLSPLKDVFFKENNMDEIQTSYLMTMLTACTSATLTAWLKNGAKETAEQIQTRIKTCFKSLAEIFN